jgi:plasmid stability protein
LHERLREQAAVDGRSMSAEAVILLRQALQSTGDRPASQRAAGRAAGARGSGHGQVSTPVVVDASVALKWVVTETGSEEASALLADLASSAVSLVVPEHLVGPHSGWTSSAVPSDGPGRYALPWTGR